ncbi:MAG: GTPase Era [Bacteroidota bacterium]
MVASTHRAGFINIVGKPNAGKSTLFNNLIAYPLSITSYKPQTTRQNIVGIAQGKDYQAIYIDTPGYLTPTYALQEVMQRNVNRALVESDLILWVIDIRDDTADSFFNHHYAQAKAPILCLCNKTDLVLPNKLEETLGAWRKRIPTEIPLLPIMAKDLAQVAALTEKIMGKLPIHPPYYNKETLTTRSERFFAAEIIRKAVFTYYKQEIPYSIEVVIDKFKEKPNVILLEATIYVERPSQKSIVIGKKGAALKIVGTKARQGLVLFFKKNIYLTQHVKVLPRWRYHPKLLAQLGYQ